MCGDSAFASAPSIAPVSPTLSNFVQLVVGVLDHKRPRPVSQACPKQAPMPCRMVLPWTSLRSYSSKHGSSVVLRPYQESCLEACTDALKSGASRIGVSLPTGSGKTTVFITLLSRILPSKTRPDASKSLIIVNSIELARQSATQALRLCPTWSVEIEQGVKHQATGKADVYVTLHPELPCN